MKVPAADLRLAQLQYTHVLTCDCDWLMTTSYLLKEINRTKVGRLLACLFGLTFNGKKV